MWAVHDFLWYFLGISAIFVAKDYLSPEYIQVQFFMLDNVVKSRGYLQIILPKFSKICVTFDAL